VFAPESAARASEFLPPIKIMYKFYKSELPLPESFLDYSIVYELQLTRESSCDETGKSLSFEKNVDENGKQLPPTHVLRFLDGAPKDAIEPDAFLPAMSYDRENTRQ
jgi:hypothetical protein